MRGCFFYHTDLGQSTVFHNFGRQIALIQYSGPIEVYVVVNFSFQVIFIFSFV